MKEINDNPSGFVDNAASLNGCSCDMALFDESLLSSLLSLLLMAVNGKNSCSSNAIVPTNSSIGDIADNSGNIVGLNSGVIIQNVTLNFSFAYPVDLRDGQVQFKK